MAEGANIEIAHHLSEHDHEHGDGTGTGGGPERARHHRTHRVFEVVEVILFAVVAIATAWSGFQAAKWDGEQAREYGTATLSRFDAEELDSLATSELTNDAALMTAWLEARDAGDPELQALLEKRMSSAYKVAFDAWLLTDPFVNPDAPKSPARMPEYRNPFRAKAKAINQEAEASFADGTEARTHGEKYVRNTVMLAMVLFVAAIAQRLKDPLLRGILNGVGFTILVLTVVSLASLPRT
ncbi:MAG: hypothetical protein ACKOA9_09505 [Actinomycetota bacterium]